MKEAVQVVEVPLVPPTDDQVILKVVFAGVNATDVNVTAGRVFTDQLQVPHDVGLLAFGVIEVLDKNVKSLKVGQPCYAKPEELIPMPCLMPELILLSNGLTARIAIDQACNVKSGDKILITAPAGSVGHIAVQWAKHKGCYVIGMTSSEEKAKLLKELGTDRVINYKTENLDEVLTKEFPEGIDIIWETIGGEIYQTLFKHLANKGRLVIFGCTSGYENVGFPDVHIPNLPYQLLLGSKTVTGFAVPHYIHLFPQYMPQLIEDIMTKKLRVVLDFGLKSSKGEFIGIDSVVNGVEHLFSRKNVGKVVIKIQDQ
ncbi:unnamed protein product [Oppiella nova]|uniref:15-oxoprostaglandin 13-reductase n=1 Tax=Oppiella nova TaxID=334625 RepID=A0A7R9MKH9_9ACAR|nr:unnamed protein product [Oppiella nova]CAG2178094.1 unnamed protein product [Oppiella nova]